MGDKVGKASRRKSEQKNSTVKQEVLNNALDVIQTITGKTGMRIYDELPQKEKISDALGELLNSEFPYDAPQVEYEFTLNFIVTAWNISLMKSSEQSNAIARVVAILADKNVGARKELSAYIKALIAKKQARYPHDLRTIVSWEVHFEGNSFRVTAAALVR